MASSRTLVLLVSALVIAFAGCGESSSNDGISDVGDGAVAPGPVGDGVMHVSDTLTSPPDADVIGSGTEDGAVDCTPTGPDTSSCDEGDVEVGPDDDVTQALACVGVECGDHGSCDGGACVCTDGYTGDACEVPPATDPCEGVDCGDHGACDGGTCVCTDGYAGDACEVPPATDPCEGVDCGDHGACEGGACVCTDGYTGTNCEVPPQTDPCEGVDCGAHGTCVSGACQCDAGWTGALCDKEPPSLPDATFVCDNKSLFGWCAAYQGDLYEGEGGDFYKDICQGTVTSACPISDLLMVCVMSQGLPEEVATYYYSGAIGPETWQFDTEEMMFSICELNGGVVL